MVEKDIINVENSEPKFGHIEIIRDKDNYITTLIMNHPPVTPSD